MNIGIIGLGRLGICKALCLDVAGYNVKCFDINKSYLENIKNKTLHTNEKDVMPMLKNSSLDIAESEEEIISQCNVIFIYIQTPSTSRGDYDHTYIDTFIDKCIIAGKQHKSKILVISSTVMPEYTDQIYNTLKDYNYDVCYNPTFIAQGSIIHDLSNPNLILIGGYNKNNLLALADIHKHIIKNNPSFHLMTPLEAEITKISINCFITAKISFANMIGDLLMSKGINPDNVLRAAGSDSRIGEKCMKYGYGFGGPCFPRDNNALKYYADSQGFNFEFCQTIDNLNKSHLIYQFESLKKCNDPIEFTYVTYKDNSDILDESQKLKLAIMLSEEGRNVVIKEREYMIHKLQILYGNKFQYIKIKN